MKASQLAKPLSVLLLHPVRFTTLFSYTLPVLHWARRSFLLDRILVMT